MDTLTKYLVDSFSTGERPRILTIAGNVRIWNADETVILAGPFDSVSHALNAKSKALDKAIQRINKKAGQ